MLKVSIVVPVYNTEKYLERCVQSLLVQTLHEIEIILVDDGATDSSPQICDRYAQEYGFVKVVHKANGGLSSARNAGMKAASGEYIGFVDSDDDVEPDMYQKMYECAHREGVDFVMSDYIRVPSAEDSYLKTLSIRGGLYQKADIVKDIWPSLIMAGNIDYGPLLSVWHCLYRKDFLEKNDLYFNEDVRWSEDNIFSAKAGYCASSFYYMKGSGLYHYYQNAGTITTSYRKGAWDVYLTMHRHLQKYFADVPDYDFTQQLKWHLIYYACNCIGQTAALKEGQQKEEIRKILETDELKKALRYVDLSQASRKLRVQIYLMKLRQAGLLQKMIQRRNSHA